jgi:replicative DNA helicase
VYEQKETDEILNGIEKRIFDLTQTQFGNKLVHIRDILDPRVEQYMAIVDNPGIMDVGKVLSNYPKMDDMLGGFKPGELIILAARPSMGKTAISLNFLINAAITQKKSVALFSLEMTKELIVDRIVSTVSSIPMYKISK